MKQKYLSSTIKALRQLSKTLSRSFYHQGPAVVRSMRNLTIGVFEHLEITYVRDVDKSINYTQSLLRGAYIKMYKAFLKECKESEKELAGDK